MDCAPCALSGLRPPPRPSYCSGWGYGLPGGAGWGEVELEGAWPALAAGCGVTVRGALSCMGAWVNGCMAAGLLEVGSFLCVVVYQHELVLSCTECAASCGLVQLTAVAYWTRARVCHTSISHPTCPRSQGTQILPSTLCPAAPTTPDVHTCGPVSLGLPRCRACRRARPPRCWPPALTTGSRPTSAPTRPACRGCSWRCRPTSPSRGERARRWGAAVPRFCAGAAAALSCGSWS